MLQKSWLLTCALLLVAVWPTNAEIIKGIMQVTGGEMD